MTESRLNLNAGKTEFIIGTQRQHEIIKNVFPINSVSMLRQQFYHGIYEYFYVLTYISDNTYPRFVETVIIIFVIYEYIIRRNLPFSIAKLMQLR